MSLRNLDALFKPSAVALVRGRGRPGPATEVLTRHVMHAGFSGPVLPVAPDARAVEGVLAYDSVAALPLTPDLAVVATRCDALLATVRALAARGVRAAILCPDDIDSAARPDAQALREAARPALLRLIGPGGGMIGPRQGLNASVHAMPPAGDLAFVTPSAAMAGTMLAWAAPRGIGFSHVITLGDMIDVDVGDTLDMLAQSGQARAMLLYIEHIEQARKFMSAARAAARIRPVIVIRGDRFAALPPAPDGAAGPVDGLDAVYEAAFRRAGMLRVESLRELFDAAETLSIAPPVHGDRLAIISNGAAPATLAADAAQAPGAEAGGAQVVAAPLAPTSNLAPNLAPTAAPAAGGRGRAAPRGTLLGADADGNTYGRALDAALGNGTADAAVAIYSPSPTTDPVATAEGVAQTLGGRRRPVFAAWLGGARVEEARRLLARANIPSYETPEDAVCGFRHLLAHRRGQEALMETPPALPRLYEPNVVNARAVLDAARAAGRARLTAGEARAVLDAFEVPAVTSETVPDIDAACVAAARIGFPVALKVHAPGIAHKSEVGGVELELDSRDAVAAAARRMHARVAEARPDLTEIGFTVQPMIRRPGAHELFLGLRDGGPFGPVIVFGHGGTAVSARGDLRVGLPPLNLMLARRLIAETRVSRLLQGYTGAPAVDCERLALALVSLSEIAATCGEIASVTINPLLADSRGVLALDADIRLHADAEAARAAGPRLAIRPYPRALSRHVATQDGLRIWLRPIRPEDEPALRAMFRHLDPEDVRLRFFSPLKELSHRFAARLTQIDYDREMALVATDPADEATIWGVVRLSTDPDRIEGEYAVLVRSDLKGRGLGYLLMRAIIDHARAQGVGAVVGDVLAENEAMLDLCRGLGFTVGRSPEDPQIRRVRLPLETAPAATPAPALPPARVARA